MDYVVWLLVSLSPLAPDGYDVGRFKTAQLCAAEAIAIHEISPVAKPVCIHAVEPWRRITPQGPNSAELWARDREAKGLPTYNDPFKPKVKAWPNPQPK